MLPDNENRTMGVAYDECRDGTEKKIAPTWVMRRHNNQVGTSLIGAGENFATGMTLADYDIGLTRKACPLGERAQRLLYLLPSGFQNIVREFRGDVVWHGRNDMQQNELAIRVVLPRLRQRPYAGVLLRQIDGNDDCPGHLLHSLPLM